MSENNFLEEVSTMLADMRKQHMNFAMLVGTGENPFMDLLKQMDTEKKLKLLHQEVNGMLGVVGVESIKKLSASAISSDITHEVGEHLCQIYMILIAIEVELTEKIFLDDLIQPYSELAAHYKQEYDPYKDKISFLIRELFSRTPEGKKKTWSSIMDINFQNFSILEIEEIIGRKVVPNDDGVVNLYADDTKKIFERLHEKYTTMVKNVFQISISLLKENYENAGHTFLQGYDREIHVSAYASAKNLVSSDYFRPDEWVENVTSVGPVFSPRGKEKFPLHIRRRVYEMYRSFIFGNWMSVVALGRSLLEYMIIDRCGVLKIEVYEKDRDGVERPKKISRLVDLAADSNLAQSLKEDMKEIVESGNDVMHPEKTRKVRVFPTGRDDALNCMKRVIKIIQVLYRIKK